MAPPPSPALANQRGLPAATPDGRACKPSCRTHRGLWSGRPHRGLTATTRQDSRVSPPVLAETTAEVGSRALLAWAKAHHRVDKAEVDRFVKRVVELFTEGYVGGGGRVELEHALPAACPLLRDAYDGFERSVDIFDFSERRSLRHAAEVVTAVDGVPRAKPLVVLPIGDALQEPFWPEGLGINRGFHNALDACWAADQWGRARERGEAAMRELVEQRQALYESKTMQMHGKNRQMLKGYRRDNSKGDAPKPAMAYAPDPATRYNPPLFVREAPPAIEEKDELFDETLREAARMGTMEPDHDIVRWALRAYCDAHGDMAATFRTLNDNPAEALQKPHLCDSPPKFAANYVLGYFKVRS